MAFDIILQRNFSPKNQFNKNLQDILTVSGTLKAGTSIINPSIIVSAYLDPLVHCNYMTISRFGRKYFITDIVSYKDTLVEIKAHCDVLDTYREEILANKAVIKRQENEWNLYLDDGSFQVYNNPMVLTKAFPSGFTGLSFVLAVAGAPTAGT